MPKAKKKPKYSYLRSKFVIIAALVLVVFFGTRAIISYVAAPAGINEIGKTQVVWSGTERQYNDCYQKEVQCAQAPCEPITVCPSGFTPAPTSSPISCTCPPGAICKIDDRCNSSPSPTIIPSTPNPRVTPPPNCTSWFDGCNTCSVKDGVIRGCTKKACREKTLPQSYCIEYSDSSTPTPTAVATIIPSPSPTLKPVQVVLTTFNASSPCGESHFQFFQFTCSNGVKRALDQSTCLNLSDAMMKARDICQSTGLKN